MRQKKLKSLLYYALLIGISIASIGCGVDTGATDVTGTVTDSLGIPLTSALVTADEGGDSATTDADGSFTVEVPLNCRGITISHDGFTSVREQAMPRYRGGAHFSIEESGSYPGSRMDSDGDGVISLEEWTGPEDVFVTVDANEDGLLSQDELNASRVQHRSRRRNRGMAGRMDADGDGVISADEWLGSDEVFSSIDTDNDGTITREEMRAAFTALQQ